MRNRGVAFPVAFAAMLIAGAALPAPAAAAPPATPPGLGAFDFDVSAGTVEGAFVQFEVPEDTDVVANYTSDGTLFFEGVAVGGYALSSQEARGSLYNVRGTSAAAQVHDNPNAIMKITLEPNATATFTLGGSVALDGWNASALSLSVSGSNRTGAVWWTCGNASLTVAADNASFAVAAPPSPCFVFFRSHVASSPSELHIAAAAGAQQLSAEVWVAESSAFDAASYGAASVVVTRTDQGIVVSVDPAGVGPRSIVIRFVQPGGDGSVQVQVDGRDAASASGIEDALDATDDSGLPEYTLHSTADGTALLVVSLPDGGPHVIHIEGVAFAPPPDMGPAIAGLALGAAAAGIAGAALFRRRR
ncbi:MAG TPA: hypothetical protein VGB42_12715 [Candidatus Thermoplasmatota archaeon]